MDVLSLTDRMRRGVAPSLFPTAGTTFPLDTLLLTLRFFPFPAASPILKLYCTSARESTVVTGPISDRLYVEINAIDMQYTSM